MKIAIFTHSSFSHISAIEFIVKSLCKENDVYCFLEQENINVYGEFERLHYIPYNKSLDKQLKDLLVKHNNFIEKKDINNIEDILFEIIHPLEYMLEGSLIYVDDLINQIKKINPNIILRDSCSLFGRIIADKLNIPVLGYTTSPTFTDKFMEGNLKKYLSYSLKRNLEQFTEYEIRTLYENIRREFNKVCQKYGVRTFPMNYLTCPDENMNFCFGTESLNFISEVEKDKYIFLRPKIFESKDIVYEPKDTIVVSSGSLISFPIVFYNYIINAYKNESYSVEISQKYFGTDVFKINNLPENIHFHNYINQTDLLKKSYVLITHGGYNSILEAIFFEVPILVYAITHEQFINALRIEELNIGLDLRNKHLTGSELKKITREIISSKIIKDNISRLKKEILSLESDAVEKYIKARYKDD